MFVLGNSRRSRQGLALGALVLTLSACGSEPEPLAPGVVITDVITNISARGGTAAGVVVAGPAPVGTSGPTATVQGITSVVNGGSAPVDLTGSAEFNRVYVSVLGADGHFDVQLPSGTSVEDLLLGIAPGLAGGSVRVRYALEGPSGIGAVVEQLMSVIRVGTGDVQISVAWTGASDVDLHVIDPAGEEVYFGNDVSASGGRLDLDSNAACHLDNKNNENIVWPVNGAPAGAYRVEVHYYDACAATQSDWVVTVQIKGHAPQVFTGSFVGDETMNPPVVVGTFTY